MTRIITIEPRIIADQGVLATGVTRFTAYVAWEYDDVTKDYNGSGISSDELERIRNPFAGSRTDYTGLYRSRLGV